MTGSPSKVTSIIQRLVEVYGDFPWEPRLEPLDELVCCILSQHSADVVSFPTFARLREAYPTWDEVEAAEPAHLAEVIRAAGLANSKARTIQTALRTIREKRGGYDLEFLRSQPTGQALLWLQGIPGVGPKTASIVVCFAFGGHAVPVDTHVFRVAKRLGLLGEKEREVQAHGTLAELVPEGQAFRFHMLLIQHGRTVCRAPKPKCNECPIRDLCPAAPKS